jgi:toxin YoeB
MRKTWFDDAWGDYLYWQDQDKKTLKKINRLIQDIERNGYHGIGQPESLKGSLAGWWSVKIDEKNRIVLAQVIIVHVSIVSRSVPLRNESRWTLPQSLIASAWSKAAEVSSSVEASASNLSLIRRAVSPASR